MSTIDDSKAVAQRFVDAINGRRFDRFDTVFAADATLTFSGIPMPWDPDAARPAR